MGQEAAAFWDALGEVPPVSLRVNPAKSSRPTDLDPIPWTQEGCYLPVRPVFTLDPALHAGAYYVQEASSMLLEQALIQTQALQQPLRALDLCAAPGGKTTHLLGLLHPESLVLANEVIKSRAYVLRENLIKWGAPNAVVSQNDARDFQALPQFFDLIVVDAPCSGEGLFRKDDAAVQEWSPDTLLLCASRQRRIVLDVWEALAPGGTLIYSTCTWNAAENEENLQWMLEQTGATSVPLTLDPDWGFETLPSANGWGYQALPHRVRGEGFFLTVLQKPGNIASATIPSVRKPKLEMTSRKLQTALRPWLSEGDWEILTLGERSLAVPAVQVSAIQALAATLHLLKAGITLGEQKKNGVIPAHALATATLLAREAFHSVELDWETAIRYLKREAIVPDLPDGWGMVHYQNLPLGFVKKMGRRANNYYPQDWRIRMEISAPKGWTLL